MATLSTVQANVRGTLDAPKPMSFFGDGSMIADAPTMAEIRYVVFRLVKKKKGRTHIDGVCDNVLNPNTKKRERIWFLNGAPSIWQSEILDLIKDKEYVRYNRRSLIFENGVCRIPIEDERALEYARANKHNVGDNKTGSGKFDFYEYDPGKEQAEKVAKQKLKIDMILKVSQMPIEKVKPLAAFLGIAFVDDLGMPKTDDGIRSELILKADTFPEMFAKYVDNEEVNVAWMVRKGLTSSLIDLTGQQGAAVWGNGKGLIAKIPASRKPLEYLTELAMTNTPDGMQFREQLEMFVAPDTVQSSPKQTAKVNPEPGEKE